jgi:PAS domain S-box-containing protein
MREHVGQTLGSVLPARLLDSWLDWLSEAAAARQPVRCRLGWPTDDGELQLEAVLIPLGDNLVQVAAWPVRQGGVAGVGVAPLARSLLDALREPLLLVGPDQRVQELNVAFERLIGRSRLELVGQPVAERLATSAARERLAATLAALASGPDADTKLALACNVRGGERDLELRLGTLAPTPGRVEAVLIEAHRLNEKASNRSATARAGLPRS